jgi:hypothetical protein
VPIAIDSSTPAIVSNTTDTATTASFTAPTDSLLVALCAIGGGFATNEVTNSGAALTWTVQVEHMLGEDSGAFGGTTLIATAVTTSAVARTVTLSSSSSSGVALKLLVITGADVTGGPVGAVGEGHATATNLTRNVYTSTVNGSRAVGIAAEEVAAGGTPTSSDVGFGWNQANFLAGVAVYKAADTASSGTVETLNFNGGGTSRDWNWSAIEVLPVVAPFTAAPPYMLGQAVNRSYFY